MYGYVLIQMGLYSMYWSVIFCFLFKFMDIFIGKWRPLLLRYELDCISTVCMFQNSVPYWALVISNLFTCDISHLYANLLSITLWKADC